MTFLVKVFEHKLESSLTRVYVSFSTLIFPFYKMISMNSLEFSRFAESFVCIFYKTRVEPGFLEKFASRNTVNSMEQKTIVFCHIDVQEYHLWWILQKTIIYSGFKTLYKKST
jgi:hypothetical protein